MTAFRTRWTSVLMGAAIFAFGLVLLVMLYALGTRAFSPPADPVRAVDTTELIGDIIQVEVRNGCGVDGLAKVVTHYLRDRGFDVVETGNHTVFNEPHSFVVDRVNDLESAKKVARAMGIDESRVIQEAAPDYYLDASIILGQDYTALTPFKELAREE